jgi:hypothetical protein
MAPRALGCGELCRVISARRAEPEGVEGPVGRLIATRRAGGDRDGPARDLLDVLLRAG